MTSELSKVLDTTETPESQEPELGGARHMIFGHYYVADVAHKPENPVHRVIAFNAIQHNSHPDESAPEYDTIVSLFSAGYEPYVMQNVLVTKLHYFQVVRHLDLMADDPPHFLVETRKDGATREFRRRDPESAAEPDILTVTVSDLAKDI